MNSAQGGQQDPALIQVDPKCIDSALRKFFQPLKTGDTRADFFAVYRKESGEFDKDYTKKYDEDLNTSLIFAGLFSAVSSAFIISVQAKSEPDPNQLTAYMQVLLHTLNVSLYPDVAPPPATWSGPDHGVLVVQCLLYASFATSLFAAFVAMLGKQWLNRFARNTGRTAAEKSWDRQNKLQGMEQWRFHIVMECLPIMLQLSLLLLGCALSSYLWSINPIAAYVVLAVTAFGVVFYVFVTVAGSLFYECPYQTPVSLVVRMVILRLSPHVPHVVAPIIGYSLWILARLDEIFRFVKSMIRRAFAPALVVEHESYVMGGISVTPAPLFCDKLINWSQHREDSKCVLWTMDASADADVLLFAFRFAADIVWYPEIATSLCSLRVSGLFFDCFLDGEVIPGAEERASHIARILASILNIHACMGYNLEAIRHIGEKIRTLECGRRDPDVYFAWWFLTLISHEEVLVCPPLRKDASPAFCIWLSQMILQSIYWRQEKTGNGRYSITSFRQPFERLLRGRKVPNAVFLNLILACAVSLGLHLNITDLHMSDNSHLTLHTALTRLNERMAVAISDSTYDEEHIRVILRLLRLWNNSGFQDLAGYCMSWVEDALDSGRPERHRYQLARDALLVLDDYPSFL